MKFLFCSANDNSVNASQGSLLMRIVGTLMRLPQRLGGYVLLCKGEVALYLATIRNDHNDVNHGINYEIAMLPCTQDRLA